MKKTGILLLMLILGALPRLQAQIRGNSINVTVQPDHNDWNYQGGRDRPLHRERLRS
jgi:hypothetical protein